MELNVVVFQEDESTHHAGLVTTRYIYFKGKC
jgi:hypothetical protein